MSSKVLQIAGVPVPVKLEKSTKAKRLSMTIRPFEGVRIAVPRWCSFQFAQEFLHKNLAWVLRNIDSIKKQENLHATVKEALRWGTVMGSFNVAAFSCDRLRTLTRAEIEQRLAVLQSIIA